MKCVALECGNLCYHQYRCDPSCYDYANGHICKHLHRVHSLHKSDCSGDISESHGENDPGDSYFPVDSPCQYNQCTPYHLPQNGGKLNSGLAKKSYQHYYSSMICPMYTGVKVQLQTTHSLLNKLQGFLTEDSEALHESLPHINSLLRNAVSSCEAALQIQTQDEETQPFMNKENVAAGKKMELQPRFSATSAGPGRKKKSTLWYAQWHDCTSICTRFSVCVCVCVCVLYSHSDLENRAKLVKLLTKEDDHTREEVSFRCNHYMDRYNHAFILKANSDGTEGPDVTHNEHTLLSNTTGNKVVGK